MDNKKERRAQLIINIITMINVIIIAILIYHFIINQKYSRKNIKELLVKSINVTNFIQEEEEIRLSDGFENKVKITQDNHVCKEEQEEVTDYYTGDLWIRVYKNDDRIYTLKSSRHILPIESEQNVKYIVENDYFQYLKKEKYDGINCLIIMTGSVKGKNYEKIWIDEKTGFILRKEEYVNGGLNELIKRKIEVNVVEDNSIEVPSLEGYTLVEEHNGVFIYERRDKV